MFAAISLPASIDGSGDCKKALPPDSPQPKQLSFAAGHRQQVYLSWVPVLKGGRIPDRAIEGRDSSGTFVARARLGYHLLPGKATRSHGCCHVSQAGTEHSFPEFEVLCDSSIDAFGHVAFDWLPFNSTAAPLSSAIAGGCSDVGEPLFIARGSVNGSRVYGYYADSLKAASFPWGGKEHRSCDFELLVMR